MHLPDPVQRFLLDIVAKANLGTIAMIYMDTTAEVLYAAQVEVTLFFKGNCKHCSKAIYQRTCMLQFPCR